MASSGTFCMRETGVAVASPTIGVSDSDTPRTIGPHERIVSRDMADLLCHTRCGAARQRSLQDEGPAVQAPSVHSGAGFGRLSGQGAFVIELLVIGYWLNV